jgi:hypothetical protein
MQPHAQVAAPNFTLKLVRPAGRAGCVTASVKASRRLHVATRFCERHRRQPARRFGFGAWALAAQPA